jgi:hypothetical protein
VAAAGRCTIDEFMHMRLSIQVRNKTFFSFARSFQRRKNAVFVVFEYFLRAVNSSPGSVGFVDGP